MSISQPHEKIPIVIIAGGQSKRFGSPKAMAELNGRPLLFHVHERLAQQSLAPIAINTNVGVADEAFKADFDILRDEAYAGCGPLAGLLSAFKFAIALRASIVATVPVDTPFLPLNMLEKLLAAGAPSIAESCGRKHPICGLWPICLQTKLIHFLESGQRSVLSWVDECQARSVDFERQRCIDPFMNINTPEHLRKAERFVHVL